MGTIFVSPGVYTKEQDFSVFASRLGITRLGLVGVSSKGPAFEVVKVSGTEEYAQRFGLTGPKLPMSYVANAFLAQANDLNVVRVLGTAGYTNSKAWVLEAGNGSVKSGATLAVIRSKKQNNGNGDFFYTNGNEFSAITSTVLGQITITGATGEFSVTGSTGPLTVSLDETQENYIVKVLGQSSEEISGTPNIYVESIYPHFIRQAVSDNTISDIKSDFVVKSTADGYTDYKGGYKDSKTPWIVSRVIGTSAKRLFQFETISDGDSSAHEIKVTVQNINLVTETFDVVVRKFEDTDAAQTIIEKWTNVCLDDSKPNFIGKIIGTTDEEYPRKSSYITVNLAYNLKANTVPAGFEGYDIRGGMDLYYKTTYSSGTSIYKQCLGISELGYTCSTGNIGSKTNIQTLEKDFFAYQGSSSGLTTTKGFHLENTADSNLFVSGDKNSLTAYTKVGSSVVDASQLKFTVCPAGGFDAWDKYRTYENFEGQFADGDINQDNIDAFQMGVDLFADPEEVDINVFATPGINLSDNASLVTKALEIIEDRADSLYIIDMPRISTSEAKGEAFDAVSILEGSGINSNYATTYWPWIQIKDNISGKYNYQSPTLLAISSIVFNDKLGKIWTAPAGTARSNTPSYVNNIDGKVNKGVRDTLYAGRINPISKTTQNGINVWGQKTLQVAESSLDRINVRRLILEIRRLVSAASVSLLFEQNDQTLRDQFKAKVEPMLLQIQNQRGLEAFKVIMDETNNTSDTIDRNTLVGKIQLKPTKVAEFIDLSFEILPSGALFSDF